MPRVNPFRAMEEELLPHDFVLLASSVAERRYREEVGFGTFAEAAGLYRPDSPCLSCESRAVWRYGLTGGGLQRFACRKWGTRFSSLTRAFLERGKSDIPTWVDFVRLMRFNIPVDAITEVCRVSHQTAWEWWHRPFEAVDGCQDRLVLRDRMWLDETYLTDTDLTHGYGKAVKHGLSKQKVYRRRD